MKNLFRSFLLGLATFAATTVVQLVAMCVVAWLVTFEHIRTWNSAPRIVFGLALGSVVFFFVRAKRFTRFPYLAAFAYAVPELFFALLCSTTLGWWFALIVVTTLFGLDITGRPVP